MKKLVVNVLVAVSAFCLAFVVWGMSTVDSIDADEDAGAESLTPAVSLRPWDVVIITVESLPIDELTPYGDKGEATPGLEELASTGIVFEQATIPLVGTSPPLTSLATGLSPENLDEFGEAKEIPKHHRSLVDVLDDQGFEILGVSSTGADDPGGRGIDTFVATDGKGRSADTVATEAIALLKKSPGSKRVLLWVHFAASVAESDRQVARLLGALEEMQRRERALIVFAADLEETANGMSRLEDGVAHIPLIMAGPSIPTGKRDRVATAVEDVVPTVLSILQIPRKAWPKVEGTDVSWRWRPDAEAPPGSN